MSYEVVQQCINQDTKEKLKPGDIVDNLSNFEIGRHLAEGNIIPVVEKKIKKAIIKPPETRKRRIGRKKKNDID